MNGKPGFLKISGQFVKPEHFFYLFCGVILYVHTVLFLYLQLLGILSPVCDT